jgi:type I restriction enzyme R subunit
VLEAQELIEAKAYHMLLHYAAHVLPNGFKAMVVARSRMATVRYQAALMKAQQQLINALTELEQTAGTLLALSPEERGVLPQGTRLLLQAYPQRDRLNQLQCAAVISASEADDPVWTVWSDERRREEYIKRFKLPLEVSDGQRSDPLALLCVQQMLLTGFDAPVVQGLYLDRRLVGHNLLQAIARVNRTYTDKTHGLVVDYLGIARQLKEALSVYNAEDIQGALVNIQDEQLRLEARHLRVHALFSDKGIDISKIDLRRDRETVDACLNLFKDARFRADFEEKLKNFSESMDAVLPRPEALRFVHNLEILGYLNKSAGNIFPEEQISIKGVGKKVRKLIDEHIAVLGIEQTVAPISITDADFEKRIDQHVSDETKASEMEHQARYYIKQHYEEDPEYYERFSQHLKRILDEFAGQWAELVEQLRSYIKKLSQERKTDATGLDPRTQLPFLDILEMEASRGSDLFGIPLNETTMSLLTPGQRQALAPLTTELVELIRGHIRVRDFWSGAEKRQDMRADIIDFLDRYDIITPTERQVEVANRLMAVARRLHRWLVA